MAVDALAYKQELFIEYLLGESAGNATDAARKAGYMGDDRTLAVTGHRLLRNPNVAARVQARLAEAAMSADEVLAHLAEIARAPWQEFLQIKTVRGEVVDVRMDLTNKVKALELLGKYHKLFTEKVEVEVVQKALIGIDLEKM